MSSIALGGIVFICLFAASLAGMALRARLPDEHLSSDSKDAIKLATAVVGTLSALALGLLIASAKSAYDSAETELRNSAGHIVLLDRVIAHYGADAEQARDRLRQVVEWRLEAGWAGASRDPARIDHGIEPVQDALRSLVPKTDAERWLQSRALEISGQIAEAHWLAESGDEGLPWPFLAIMVFWLAVLFATFGLLAPGNGTVVLVLLVCALSVAGAVFLVADMTNPYRGLIYISDAPLREALAELGRT